MKEQSKMVGPKSMTSALQDLRPVDGSSGAIWGALCRLEAMQTADAAEISSLEASRPAMLLSLEVSPAEIDQADQTVRQLRIRAEQLVAMKPELQRMLGESRIREENQEYSSRLAAVRAKAEAWNKRFLEEYPAWCASIQPLFEEEKKIEDEIDAVTHMPGASRVNRGVTDNTHYTRQIMLRHGAGTMSSGTRWGVRIQLPPVPEDVS